MTGNTAESKKAHRGTYRLIGFCAGFLGLVGGAILHSIFAGHHFSVLKEKIYPTPNGDLRWRVTTDTWSFLDPGDTQLELNGRTLYKAKRYFQEAWPVAHDVKVTGNTITWDDGEYAFSLQITPSTEQRQNPAKQNAGK